MKITASALLLMILAGCAPQKVWRHSDPNKPYDERMKDHNECSYEAEKHGHVPYGSNSFVNAFEATTRKNKLLAQCLTLRGYSLHDQ